MWVYKLKWFNKYKIKQLSKIDILYSRHSRKKQENNGVGDIFSLFQRHCQIIGLKMSLE